MQKSKALYSLNIDTLLHQTVARIGITCKKIPLKKLIKFGMPLK